MTNEMYLNIPWGIWNEKILNDFYPCKSENAKYAFSWIIWKVINKTKKQSYLLASGKVILKKKNT